MTEVTFPNHHAGEECTDGCGQTSEAPDECCSQGEQQDGEQK